MCRCADVLMCRCADVQMCRCADVLVVQITAAVFDLSNFFGQFDFK